MELFKIEMKHRGKDVYAYIYTMYVCMYVCLAQHTLEYNMVQTITNSNHSPAPRNLIFVILTQKKIIHSSLDFI